MRRYRIASEMRSKLTEEHLFVCDSSFSGVILDVVEYSYLFDDKLVNAVVRRSLLHYVCGKLWLFSSHRTGCPAWSHVAFLVQIGGLLTRA